MNKKLILHVGTGKTGTTALQSFFWQNRDSLLEDGIKYPEIGFDYYGFAHHFLGHMWNKGWKTKEELQGYDKDQLLLSLKQEYDSSDESILISSEAFTGVSVMRFSECTEDLLKYFAPKDIKVVIFLRRQDLHYQALYKELIKNALLEVPIENFKPPKLYDYYRWVAKWVELVGLENVAIQPYERGQFINGSIFETFFSLIGLRLSEKYQLPEKAVNSSMDNLSLQVCQIANTFDHLDMFSKRTFNQKVRDVLDSGQKGKKFKEHDLLSPERRLEIISDYSESNEKIAREFLNRSDGKLFKDPLPSLQSSWVPPQELSKEILIETLIKVWKTEQ